MQTLSQLPALLLPVGIIGFIVALVAFVLSVSFVGIWIGAKFTPPLQQASTWYCWGYYSRAGRLCQEALDSSQPNIEARFDLLVQLAKIREAQHRFGESKKLCQEALLLGADRTPCDALLTQANAYRVENQWREAQQCYQEVIDSIQDLGRGRQHTSSSDAFRIRALDGIAFVCDQLGDLAGAGRARAQAEAIAYRRMGERLAGTPMFPGRWRY